MSSLFAASLVSDTVDMNSDPDHDGLTIAQERDVKLIWGNSTNPYKADTDGDGFSDKYELEKGTNPLDRADYPQDFWVLIIAILVVLVFFIIIMILIYAFHDFHVKRKLRKHKKIQEQAKKQENQPRQYALKDFHLKDYYPRAMMSHDDYEKGVEEKKKKREELFKAFEQEDFEDVEQVQKVPDGIRPKEIKSAEVESKDPSHWIPMEEKLNKKPKKQKKIALQEKVGWLPLNALSSKMRKKIDRFAEGRDKEEIDRVFYQNRKLKQNIIKLSKKHSKQIEKDVFDQLDSLM